MSDRAASDMPHLGLIGLAVMGQNLALNIARRGIPLWVHNRSADRTERFISERAKGLPIQGAATLAELVAGLARPRAVLLMVKAGTAVDDTLRGLVPLLEPGDLVLDGGNSHFRDTARRERELAARGLRYLGTGISGGEQGALLGPSIMPGGDPEAYRLVQPVLEQIAAQVGGEPCCTLLGGGGAGHFVKTVHNGIEYGDMQLIAEVYLLLRDLLGWPAARSAELFARWNEGPLGSFLVETTATVLRRLDPESGQPLVELILDRAEQKGTGRWTAEAALELGVAVPTIDAALQARTLSAHKEERGQAARLYPPTRVPGGPELVPESEPELIQDLHDALLGARITAYAQGFALLAAGSRELGFGLQLPEIARIWRGGCIIRARLLEPVRAAYQADPELANLLFAPSIQETIRRVEPGWRRVVVRAVEAGLPVPALAASLAYFDTWRKERLAANLIQAQRDQFGAHTYERLDRPGSFHTEWE